MYVHLRVYTCTGIKIDVKIEKEIKIVSTAAMFKILHQNF